MDTMFEDLKRGLMEVDSYLAGERTGYTTAPPFVPTGTIKTFGEIGPKYEVGHALRQLPDGDWMIEILLVETGEKTEYRLSRLNADPEAL